MHINIYILTYNRAEYLKLAIESILKQTYKEFTLYVLDNCSQDNTEKVVKGIRDERLHYIRHKENIGGIGNINYAIDHCQAEYMVIFHDDDEMLPNFIQDEVSIIEENPEVDLIAGNAIYFGKTDGLVKRNFTMSRMLYTGMSLFEQYMRYDNCFIFPSIMYRKSFLQEKNIRMKKEVGPCADVVLYFDIMRMGGKAIEISKPIMRYRIHNYQDSQLHYFPMHLQLYRYFKNDPCYFMYYKREKKGRIRLYNNYSRHLFFEWMKGIRDQKVTREQYRTLADVLMIKVPNIWKLLYYGGNRIPWSKKTMLKIYERIKR